MVIVTSADVKKLATHKDLQERDNVSSVLVYGLS